MQLIKWIGVPLFTMLTSISKAQPEKKLQFNHLSDEHGLSQTVFRDILQDRKGYMWFATQSGLLRYDGYSFTTFQNDPFNKNSPSSYSNVLREDRAGNIWVGGDGLSKYDPHTAKFTTWRHDNKNKYSLLSDDIRCLITDKEGKLWIATDKGLCSYDSASGKFISLSDIIPHDTLCNQDIRDLLVDRDDLLWIGTENGINIFDPRHKKLRLFEPADRNYAAMTRTVECMLQDDAGDIWISFWDNRIYRYKPSTGATESYRHSAADPYSLRLNLVSTMTEDNHHNLWMGMSFGGISVYQPAKNSFRNYRADANDLHSLSTNQVIRLFQDQGKTLWIGTAGAGLNSCYPEQNKFRIYQNWDKDYTTHWPISLYKDHSGKIYMTTHGTGLQEFDPATGKFISYNIVLPHDSLSFGNVCFGTLEASDGNLWMVSYAEGLHKFDRKTRKLITIHTTLNNPGTGFHNQANCIVEDSDKRFWIGTNYGLKCYDLKTKIFSGFEKIYRDTNLLSSDGIVNLHLDNEGILWIAGEEGGMTLFNTKTGEIKIFKHDDNNPHSISSNDINYFYDDGKGLVWVGTTGGLNRFDKRTEQFVAYTIKEGLPDNSIKGILADDQGNLWLSSNKGICRFTPPSSRNDAAVCRNYNRGDGLPGDEYDYNTCVKGDDGTLYFASNAGLVAFKPAELKDNDYIPPVVITDFSVFNKSIAPNDATGILKLPADETKEITLSYKQNDLSFSFSALSYVHPEKNRYAYMLEGYDKEWIYTDATRRVANYTNLDPATYTFKVKGSNNDGLWNETPVEIKLIITPPWWQTLWFKLLCVLAAGLTLYAIYNNRMRKARDIRRIRNKIASDLHDDLGATLSSISIMSELVNQQVKDQSPQASSLLEKIGSSSRNMIESVNDMVWAINPQNDSFENIIKRMRNFASEILSAKDIAFHFDFDKNLLESKLKMEMRRNFYLIFKEAVNNVAKYSRAANAFVMIWSRENNLKMTIRDDGSGFEMNNVKAGNGLINMQQRAEIMKARFNLESIPGKGTIIELEFKNG